MRDKRGFEFSFAWLFAIIVGAAILFLAIYGVIRVMDTGGQASSAETGREIGILLNPLETGFEESQSIIMTMPAETRIYNSCDSSGVFGNQIIKVSQKNFGRWTDTDIDIGFRNKYIFSDGFEEGRNFFIFSKPFHFPFKIADLVYLSSAGKKYCFADAPTDIKEEIEDLNQENLLVENCPQESINVCFGSSGSGCNIIVNGNLKSVEKNGQTVYYETDALMYAAIFSEPGIYECQLKRLMSRESELLSVYESKASILLGRGCSSGTDVGSFKSVIESIGNSYQLESVLTEMNYIEAQNNIAECRLW